MKNLWLLLLVISIRPIHAQLFGGQIKSPRAIISQLNCANATVSATVYSNVAINGINVTIPIIASNGGTYISQAYSSTGVTGLTLISGYGMIPSGSSNIVFTLSGTANTVGNALFNVAIGGQTCSISVVVASLANQYPANSVFCVAGATAIVDVTNPTTGKTWMDRNLGANQVATSSTDQNAYGDLYQWGRRADGHQCRTSPTTATLSSVDQPAHGNFILAPNAPYDWRSPQNTNLWQGVNGLNNPCSSGYRLPTETELNNERLSWSQNNSVGAFASPLKWTLAGYRDASDGTLNGVGAGGHYWSSTVSGTSSRSLNFGSSGAYMSALGRAYGLTVRCIKETVGSVGAINCGGATTSGNLFSGSAANNVSISVPYTGGNAGFYAAQNVTSTGVTGLTAALAAGTLANGNGSITYIITGTPASAGTASFAITLGGQSCSFTVNVAAAQPQYPANTVNCNGVVTVVNDVTDPNTGLTWMDRNLGASQVAAGSNDPNAYGDLYQWGRRADGHQCRTSPTTATLSSVDQPAHGNFILAPNAPADWRSPQNTNLWQGVNGVNNPCPSGYRLPTEGELVTEQTSWVTNNCIGSFTAPLKWTWAGMRSSSSGSLSFVNTVGYYWSSTVSGNFSRIRFFDCGSVLWGNAARSTGNAVRCIKEPVGSVGALNCGGATTSGNLFSGSAANNVSTSVPYTGGNGGFYAAQNLTSTGVTGLTATLSQGLFANGAGSVTYTITGTPASAGTASFAITVGGQSCSFTINVSAPAAALSTINCAGATTTGTLSSGTAANGVSTAISYTGGNAGTYSAQNVASTGVTGLTATLSQGVLINGAGSLNFTISGTPASAGNATFTITVGGQSCSFTVSVAAAQPQYPANTVNCNGVVTVVNDVTNPTTGLIWMDRNLGASQVATSSTDQNAYGDLYQWGRRADGHQCRTSPTTATLSSIDQPAHGNFILAPPAPFDWRSPQNANLWQGVNGVNNPCPSGYRLPTQTELNNERLSWGQNNNVGAFASPLKWTLAGNRSNSNGTLGNVGTLGDYWSSTVSGTTSRDLGFHSSNAFMNISDRANGLTVRCIKN